MIGHRRALVGIVMAVLGLLVAATATAALNGEDQQAVRKEAQPRQSSTASRTAGCVVPSSDALEESGSPTGEGYFSYEEWIANDASQQALEPIHKELDARFGHVDKKTLLNRELARGLIGVAIDDHAKELVVVVDPSLVNVQDVAADLDQILAAVTDRLPPHDLAVRVQGGCFSAEALQAAAQVIRAREWHPAADEARYGWTLDAHTSTYTFSFDPKYREVAEALAERLGDRVTITYGGAERGPTSIPEQARVPGSTDRR